MRADGEGSQRSPMTPSPARMYTNGSNSNNGGASSSNIAGGASLSPLHSPTLGKAANGSSAGAVSVQARSELGSNGASTSPSLSSTNGHSHTQSKRTGPYFGHSREEVARILIQGLTDLGYEHSARTLSRESGFALEGQEVAAFRNAVLRGEWKEAEWLLFGGEALDDGGGGVGIGDGRGGDDDGGGFGNVKSAVGNGSAGTLVDDGSVPSGLLLAEGANKNEMLFWMRQQKYLELLEARELGEALGVLRGELTPLHRDQGRLHALSSLLMCTSAEELRNQAQWDGAHGESRSLLLSELSKSISPSVMIPERRLAVLLDEVKYGWIVHCPYHNTSESPSLYHNHTCDREDFPLHLLIELSDHKDEVWFLAFSHDGTKLATAGKDCRVLIYDTTTWTLLHELPEHQSGVCYGAWSPDDSKLITCTQAPDATARVWDAHTGKIILALTQLTYSVTSAAWAPNGETFVIGSHDVDDPLCVWNIDNKRVYQWREANLRVHDLAISPDGQRLVVLLENRILVYNFVTREKIAEWRIDGVKTTSVNISADSKHMLVSMNEDSIKLMHIDSGEELQHFEGHKQTEFVVRSAFGGAEEGLVVSGSEDSRIYIWRTNGAPVIVLDAHQPGCVNAVAWHPHDPCIFASAGDDHKVRIWANRKMRDEFNRSR